jgi:hypothetical protein
MGRLLMITSLTALLACGVNVIQSRPSDEATSGGGGTGGAVENTGGGGGAGFIPGPDDPGPDENEIIDPAGPCDAGLAVDDADPRNAARAAGLCKDSDGPESWGVISTRWTGANGGEPSTQATYAIGHGIVTHFGAEIGPRDGVRLLALSSGTARNPGDPGWVTPGGFDKGISGQHPAGFPQEANACPNVITGDVFDDVALEIEMRAPAGAESLAFDFNFFTFEWPVFVCTQYNDFFVALLDGANVSFDADNNPISVNNALLSVCNCPGPTCAVGGLIYDCALGAGQLSGTGFEPSAASGWIQTTAPAAALSIVTLRWTVYDSGDGILDSTTIIDNFRWLSEPSDGAETIPVPK